MTTSEAEIKNLVQQHQAIHAHMRFLVKALTGISPSKTPETAYATPLQERIAVYRWSLYDFREAIQLQIELDERIFQGDRSNKDIAREHRAIREQIDRAICLVENVAYHKIDREDLKAVSQDITESVNKICKSLDRHMAREDALARKR
ncbi:MAG: hypothetical protein A2Z29_09335 [Chloroflexi bacterium RBG_16_56_11]|nr:MAG: hypothetical protein A2Z29_09335 [Chloroflexi bacterium RBG_16_56_11]